MPQVDGAKCGPIFLQAFKAGGVRAAETIDGLIRIADSKQAFALLRPGADQAVLDGVDILKFVYQQIIEPTAPAGIDPAFHPGLSLIHIYHLHFDITLKDLAAYVHLSPRYLSHIFKEEVGISVVDYIQLERVEEAKKLLRFSSYSFAEILSLIHI